MTFKDKDVREAVALKKANADTVVAALADPDKSEIYYHYMDSSKVKMAGDLGSDGNYIKGIEDEITSAEYNTDEHMDMVVKDIADNWVRLSYNSKFHAIFATTSIPQAISYYRKIKTAIPSLKVTCQFDSTIDNNGGIAFKEDGLVEIIEDYNTRYGRDFSLKNYDKLKKDIAARLAHKSPHQLIERTPENQIDLLIVVDQMLTGFDSKWINTLYLDKLLKYESIIQAFSRTNRLFGPEKRFGTIRYYRYPHTMEQNIEKAVKLYSGDKPIGLFVEKLEHNLNKINEFFDEISYIFKNAGVSDFEKLPKDFSERGKFAKQFKLLNEYLEAAKIQGFKWDQLSYSFSHGSGIPRTQVNLHFDETTYLILVMRYKELFNGGGGEDGGGTALDLVGYLTEIDTGKIDTDYMNTRFEKYLKILSQESVDPDELRKTLDELHKSFAMLTQEEQKFANIFLHDVESGDIKMEGGKTFREYILEYQLRAKNDQIHQVVTTLGVNEKILRNIMAVNASATNINEFGRFDNLKDTVDFDKAKEYFENLDNNKIPPFKVKIRVHNLLQEFILKGGFDL